MTPARLIGDLAAEIKKATGQVNLPLETQGNVGVEILTQYLPEDLFEDTSYLPFVLVELISIKDEFKEGSTAQVGLTVGTFAKEADGWLDAFHLMEVVRQQLLERRVIGRRFRLRESQWEVPETQPRPFFYVNGLLTYELFQPQEIVRIK